MHPSPYYLPNNPQYIYINRQPGLIPKYIPYEYDQPDDYYEPDLQQYYYPQAEQIKQFHSNKLEKSLLQSLNDLKRIKKIKSKYRQFSQNSNNKRNLIVSPSSNNINSKIQQAYLNSVNNPAYYMPKQKKSQSLRSKNFPQNYNKKSKNKLNTKSTLPFYHNNKSPLYQQYKKQQQDLNLVNHLLNIKPSDQVNRQKQKQFYQKQKQIKNIILHKYQNQRINNIMKLKQQDTIYVNGNNSLMYPKYKVNFNYNHVNNVNKRKLEEIRNNQIRKLLLKSKNIYNEHSNQNNHSNSRVYIEQKQSPQHKRKSFKKIQSHNQHRRINTNPNRQYQYNADYQYHPNYNQNTNDFHNNNNLVYNNTQNVREFQPKIYTPYRLPFVKKVEQQPSQIHQKNIEENVIKKQKRKQKLVKTLSTQKSVKLKSKSVNINDKNVKKILGSYSLCKDYQKVQKTVRDINSFNHLRNDRIDDSITPVK